MSTTKQFWRKIQYLIIYITYIVILQNARPTPIKQFFIRHIHAKQSLAYGKVEMPSFRQGP